MSGTIIYQSRIYRADLQANPTVLYVFGDNFLRRGMGGQAGEMRGEPNAVGVATKWAPSHRREAFFSDDQFERIIDAINADVHPLWKHLDAGGVVVAPLDGIGTGLSQLPTRAPRIYRYICDLGLGAVGPEKVEAVPPPPDPALRKDYP